MTRTEKAVTIEYADARIARTHISITDELRRMSDHQLLEWWNESVRGREELAAAYEHVAVEVPVGKPQIEYFDPGYHWTPRGDVLRCEIESGSEDDLPVIHIDEHELSWQEFGRMLLTHAGWGMRIIFVPDDETHEPPRIVVREPKDTGSR
jgi:hypothetical protein